MPAEGFLRAANRYRCKTNQLQRTLRRQAVHKDGSRHNADDSNLLFPPSMIKDHLSSEFVAAVLGCSCRVCEPIESEPFNDEDLNKEIRGEPEARLLLAILVFMGAGFAMRKLYFYGLGRDNDLDVEEKFANNASLKSTLFQHLPALFGSTPAPSIDEIKKEFCATFKKTRQLFKPPSFRGETYKNIESTANLPFIHEAELRSRHSSYARLYKFQIHPEFCSLALSQMVLVRKELTVANIVADRERNVLEFLRQKHPHLIRLHFAYHYQSSSNLVFSYFPMDLRHVLREDLQPAQQAKVQGTPRLEGSIFDSWLWKNLKGVVDALPHVHDPDIDTIGAHFDLKPANILVDDLGNLVVTDFGLSRIKERARNGHTSLTNPGGDFNYRPPPDARWNRKYDIWSLACIMIEIIIYLQSGVGAVNKFSEDLEKEDNVETRSQTFWKQDRQGRYILKKRVKTLLDELQNSSDQYLKEVGRLLQSMLDIDPGNRPEVTEVCEALFGQNSVPAQRGGTIQVAGANTRHPLKNMQVTVRRDELGLYNPCYLDWRNIEDNVVSLKLTYTLGGQICSDSVTRPRNTEEFVPRGIYKHPDIPGGSTNCGFRHLHSNCDFQFAQRKDLYNFQTATTRQAVVPGSSTITTHCSLTLKRSGLHIHPPLLDFSGTGQIQIWRQIGDDKFRQDFVDDDIPTEADRLVHNHFGSMSLTQPQFLGNSQKLPSDVGSDSSDAYRSSSANGTSIREDEPTRDPRRLVIFLNKKSCRYLTIPLSQGKAVLSKRDQGPNYITFERRHNQPYFPVGLFGDFGKYSSQKPGCPNTPFPGIPLDPSVLEDREKEHATNLEIKFPSPDARSDFLKFYHQVFLPQ